MRSFTPTPATVLALLALIVAMTGTGLAAKSYVISSSSQIKDGTITGRDIKKASISGANVKDQSLTPADFTGSLQGPQGPQGPKGDPGTPGWTHVAMYHGAAGSGSAFATCGLSGQLAIAGGAASAAGFVNISRPNASLTGWEAEAHHADATPATLRAYVVCAS